jgi:pentatricopeptide repeat protein
VEGGVLPDEGSCIQVLHVCGRHGLNGIATDVIRVLQKVGIPLREIHLAPLLHSYCTANNIKDAFRVLSLIQSNDVDFSSRGMTPLTSMISRDLDSLDRGFSTLEEIHKEGGKVELAAVHAVMNAANTLHDLQRAVGIHKACSDLGVTPTIETYNILLSACVTARHRELGERMLAELRQNGLSPNAGTYERMIILYLKEHTYEDAFFMLEEMKGAQFVPPRSVYEAIVRKCVVARDVRWKLAVDEMKLCGYALDDKLADFIDNGGSSPDIGRRN